MTRVAMRMLMTWLLLCSAVAVAEHPKPKLIKLPIALADAMENTPVIFGGRPLLVFNYRDDTKAGKDGYKNSMYLCVRDLDTGKDLTRFAAGHSFASAYVNDSTLHVFASEGTDRDWFQSIYRFSTTDLKTWQRAPAIAKEDGECLFNCSVCGDDRGYVMAYESNRPVQFCFKFARTQDLSHWNKIPGLVFTGAKNEYSACPVIRYCAPYYYVIYLHAALPGHNGWISFLARSRDLATWELSPMNPILEAGRGEGINNSDVDLFEWQGNTYLFYACGNQANWSSLRMAFYRGPMQQFFAAHFPADLSATKISARRR